MRVQYLGSDTAVYPDYTDGATGKALVATIGGIYDITPAVEGVPDAPEGRFAVLAEEPKQIEPAKESVPETITPEAGE